MREIHKSQLTQAGATARLELWSPEFLKTEQKEASGMDPNLNPMCH